MAKNPRTFENSPTRISSLPCDVALKMLEIKELVKENEEDEEEDV